MISLIISTFNRGHLLEKSLKRLSFMTQPDEIIVVDDGSSDNTAEVCERYGVKRVYRDYPFWDSCSIPKNIGLKHAKGDIVIYSEPENLFIEDVVEVAKTLPENHYYYQKWVYFGKRNAPEFPIERLNDPMSYIDEFGWNEWITNTVDVHGGQSTYTKANMVSPWCLIVRRKDLMNIGGWDEDMSAKNGGGAWGFDDIDLITRLRESGVNAMQGEFSVVHQWHDRPSAEIQDSWVPNEKLMKAKQADDGSYLPEFIKANKNRKWGQL
jgi:glycosyltransferase involved in cell wall biosynthesis